MVDGQACVTAGCTSVPAVFGVCGVSCLWRSMLAVFRGMVAAAARAGRNRVCWGPVLRVTVSSEPPQGRNAARIRVRCRVRGGSLYMLLDLGRLKDMLLQCGSGHDS